MQNKIAQQVLKTQRRNLMALFPKAQFHSSKALNKEVSLGRSDPCR